MISGGGPYHNLNSSSSSHNTTTLHLYKDEHNPSFGFSIKGGTEFGIPVQIWRVEKESLGHKRGLFTGQRVIQANGVDFTQISHSNALKVLKGQSFLSLVLNMNSGSSSNIKSASMEGSNYFGRPSSSSQPSSSGMSSYLWIDHRGQHVSPPTPTQISNKRIINIEINPGQNLGLMIRGGCEYGLGIYVTGVDHGSVAQRAGLQRGDELLEVNGRNFSTITHDKAVQILKSCRKMTIVANYIGKIPADNQAGVGVMPQLIDSENTELIDLGSGVSSAGKLLTTSMGESHTMHHHNILMDSTNVTLFDDEDQDLIAEEEKLNDQNLELDFASNSDANNRLLHQDLEGMIEEKARTVLTKNEHSRFTFYRLEYQQGFLPIQTFVRILLELLNTVEKYTLLTEVREIIRPIDLTSFDELIYNKEVTCGAKKMHREFNHPQEVIMPIEQQMHLPLVPVTSQQPMNGGGGVVRRMSPNGVNYSNQLYNETTFTTPGGETNRQILLTHGDAQSVVAKMQQQKLQQGFIPQQIASSSPSANSCVRYKVRVQKTKPILGIAIEGGCNTPHRLPRIIDVNKEGSALGSQLKPGQVLLSVDGKKLDGLSHEDIARTILDSYVDMSKAQIEFLVVEAKVSFQQSQHQLLNQNIPQLIPPPT